MKAYKLKFDKLVGKYNKMKRIFEKPFFKENKEITVKKYKDNNNYTWEFYKNEDYRKVNKKWMTPYQKFCTKKIFLNPIYKEKIDKIPRVEINFVKVLSVEDSNLSDEEKNRMNIYDENVRRTIINCQYYDSYSYMSEYVREGRKVQVRELRFLRIHRKHK